MDIHVPMWVLYVFAGGALFVAGMVAMFAIGLLAGRKKPTEKEAENVALSES